MTLFIWSCSEPGSLTHWSWSLVSIIKCKNCILLTQNSYLYSSIKHETLNSKHIAGGRFCAERFHTTATLSYPVVVEIFGKYKTTPAPAGDVIKQRYKLYARVNGLITSRRIFIILQNCSLKYTRLLVTKIFLGPNINKTWLIAPNFTMRVNILTLYQVTFWNFKQTGQKV